jgi:hypothetical protein
MLLQNYHHARCAISNEVFEESDIELLQHQNNLSFILQSYVWDSFMNWLSYDREMYEDLSSNHTIHSLQSTYSLPPPLI